MSGGGIDPLNMMAQLRQQEYQQAQLARMAQSMDVQDLQAQIAAQRELRQAEAAQRQAGLYGAQQQEAEQKIQAGKIDLYKNMFQNFVNDQKSLDSFVTMMERDFPQGVAAFKGKTYSDDWKQSLLKPEGDYMEAGGEVYQKTARGLRPAPIIQPEAIPGPRQDMATALIKEREGFIEKPKYDVNAYRAGYGSDTVTLPDGTVQKVTPGMRVSPEDAERDLQRRIQTEFVPKAAAKVGEEVWSTLPENTRAALTSVAYNYGTVPSRIVPAVQSGNPETIARAIESLAGDNKGVNAGRRMQEANIARGTAMPGSRAVPAFAAGGAPSFMGGPEIMPPINMMAPPAAPMNAMAAPALPTPSAPQPAQPATAATVGTRKQLKGQSNIDKTLDKMLGSYEKLSASGDIVSSATAAASPLSTIGTYLKGTALGQDVERARGSKAQDVRNRISALRGQLLQDIKEATGQTSKELDSNFELKMALERLGDPTMSIESIRAIVSDLSARYGSGKVKLPEEEAAPAPAAPAAAATQRTIVKRGTYNGRPVVQYSDGTIDYAD
jgi:GH24 family phage-related lysozyme (muramidase)